ncbi:MAG: substrate-binding domain-containing protein [Chloroflexi bacterium OHK40]
MPTIKDVARQAGVSTMTVSRVINNSGYISPATRERVERAIAELDYLPNALARSLRFKQTRTLALVLSDITNPFFTTVARGVEDAARAQGFSVLLCNTDETDAVEREYLSILLQKQVDGVLLVPAREDSTAAALLQSRGVPTVILDRRLRGAKVDSVRGDSEQGAYEVVRHLIGLGHRRIAVLIGPLSVSTAADRVAGYRRALREAGIPVDEALIVEDSFSAEGGYRATLRVLRDEPRPTAIFAGSNFIAFGAFRALREARLRVPEAISLVAFDDLPEGWLMAPFLTAVNQPAYEIGQRATALLLDRLAGRGAPTPQEVILPTELIIRRSSAPPCAS